VYNTLGETTCCAWRHVICCISFFCFAYVAYIDVFPRIPKIWRHDTIVRQRRSRVTHSVLVQDFVSGLACCMNKPHHNSSLSRLVVILVHTRGSTWYKVLYHHTMYVMGIYNFITILEQTAPNQVLRYNLVWGSLLQYCYKYPLHT
jgi:hypothetical protein